MRLILVAALCAAGIAGSAAADPASPPKAVSASDRGVNAVFRGPVTHVGYSWKSRRAATCLATYPGLYDPKTDLVRVRPGVAKRCDV